MFRVCSRDIGSHRVVKHLNRWVQPHKIVTRVKQMLDGRAPIRSSLHIKTRELALLALPKHTRKHTIFAPTRGSGELYARTCIWKPTALSAENQSARQRHPSLEAEPCSSMTARTAIFKRASRRYHRLLLWALTSLHRHRKRSGCFSHFLTQTFPWQLLCLYPCPRTRFCYPS